MLKKLILIVSLGWGLTACTAAPDPAPTRMPTFTPPPAPTFTSEPVPPTATASATTSSVPTATIAEAPIATPPTKAPAGAVPESPVLPYAWTERTVFESGLQESARWVLSALPQASVYHLDLTLDAGLDELGGRQAVHYTNTESEPLDKLFFRLYPPLADGATDIHHLAVNGETVAPTFNLAGSAMNVPLGDPLAPGETVVVDMSFTVRIPTDGGGNYATFALAENVLALAHFYPILAVYNEQGWDLEIPAENGDVIHADSSFYLVRLAAPVDLMVVGSGVVIDEQTANGQQVLTFAGGPMRDFYLAASYDYTVSSRTVDGVTVNSYGLPNTEAGTEAALVQSLAALDSFGTRFGPYPYTEFDIVPTATQALGVEYPGVIAMNMRLYEAPDGYWFESTIAHEVAHQWFYGVVGNDQLAEPWLDEALAQYLTYLYYVDTQSQAAALGYKDSWTRRWDAVNQNAIPIGQPVEAYADPQAYSGIVYGRGPLFYDTLAQGLGDEALNAALRDYYQTYRWQLATTADLRASLEESCQCNLEDYFAAWVYD